MLFRCLQSAAGLLSKISQCDGVTMIHLCKKGLKWPEWCDKRKLRCTSNNACRFLQWKQFILLSHLFLAWSLHEYLRTFEGSAVVGIIRVPSFHRSRSLFPADGLLVALCFRLKTKKHFSLWDRGSRCHESSSSSTYQCMYCFVCFFIVSIKHFVRRNCVLWLIPNSVFCLLLDSGFLVWDELCNMS